MMYVTEQQMIDRFDAVEMEQLTDLHRRGMIDTDVLAAAITDASATIDSYLQRVRTLPLSQVVINASPLARYCGDLAMFYLYSNGAPEHVEKSYDKAITWLRDIAAGRASLGAEDAPAISGGRMVTAQGVSGTDWGSY